MTDKEKFVHFVTLYVTAIVAPPDRFALIRKAIWLSEHLPFVRPLEPHIIALEFVRYLTDKDFIRPHWLHLDLVKTMNDIGVTLTDRFSSNTVR